MCIALKIFIAVLSVCIIGSKMLQEVLITQLRGTESGANDIKEEYDSAKNFRQF